MSEDILDQIDNALADVSLCFCGCKTALRATSPSPWFASEECQARWAARLNRGQDGSGKEAERVTAAAVEALGEYMERVLAADAVAAAAGPSAGGVPALVDIRRQVQDGTAPAPGTDRVHDACRAEVARQGLHEYWLDGVRYVIDHRRPFLGPAIDGAMESVTQDLAAALDELVERARAADGPSDPSIDVSRDGYYRYGCPQSGCDWAKITRFRPHLLDLIRAHDLEQHVPLRSWWRRILPRGRR